MDKGLRSRSTDVIFQPMAVRLSYATKATRQLRASMERSKCGNRIDCRLLIIRLSAAILCLASAAGLSVAQAPGQDDPPDEVRLILIDGQQFVGTVSSETEERLVFVTRSGIEFTLRKAQIEDISPLNGRGISRMDPNRSRILFAPTARSLPRKSGYLADYELLFPFVAYGPGAGISLAAGFSLIPGLGGQIVYAAPKFTFYEREKGAVAAGLLAFTYVGKDAEDISPLGLVYGVGTIGPPHASLSLGLAVGWSEGDFMDRPAFMAGGNHQLSDNVALISENYLIGDADSYHAIVSAGVRFFGDRITVDLAFLTSPEILDEEGWPLIPWVGFAYNFGPK